MSTIFNISNKIKLNSITPLLLDLYTGAAAAYSLRSLSNNTTNVVRVREDSGNTEQDFTAEEVTDGTLESFVGAGNNGYVVTWYDQAGSNNATQAAASAQPLIVDSGVLVTENGKAAVEYDGAGDQLALASSINLGNRDFSVNLVYRSLGTSSEDYVLYGDSGSSRMRLYNYLVRLYISNSTYDFASANNFGSQYLYTLEADTAKGLQVYRDGTATGSEMTIGNGESFVQEFIGYGSIRPINGRLQEVIIYNSDQSSNRVSIEENINNHYNIY
jgi:hypothetical protein